MNSPRKFKEYVAAGTIIKISPNKPRAEFLIEESRNSLEGLNERIEQIGINSKNANSIVKDCHDMIMELIRARLLLDGYTSSGAYAHEAEVSYLAELKFSDNEVIFLNGLRFFRNSVTYYGKILDEEYAKEVFRFMNKLLPRLYSLFK
ncbi:MAG: hypothetical protein KKE23_03330 [Nanoarchaeota archaeon]|nr:hypothetical protein [Nanoarchaeota archaeon]